MYKIAIVKIKWFTQLSKWTYLAVEVAPVYVALISMESKSANVINKCSLVAGRPSERSHDIYI